MSNSPEPLRILVVCTGNICRSPAVERLLARELAGLPAAVGSAGTHAVVGHPMTPQMAALVGAAGADPTGFAARQLTADLVREADLVLALTREHRAAVVGLEPAAVRRVFTLRELARLLALVDASDLDASATPAERLAGLLRAAAAQRGRAIGEAAADDVADPYGGSDAVYRRSFATLQPAAAQIAAALRALG